MKRKLLFLFLVVIYAITANADSKNGIVYVKVGATGTGASWDDALGDIQAAITKANEVTTAPKDVWVAAGEYPISTAITLTNNVSLYGGFLGTESAIIERIKIENGKPWEFTNATVLKGIGQRIMETAANFTVETFVDGFTFTGGNGIGGQLNNTGGAIVTRGNTTLQNSILTNNITTGNGGAINMAGGTVQNCYISNNTGATGGGIYNNTTTISTVQNCIIENNKSTSTNGGGAIRSQGTGQGVFKNLIITNNQALNGATLTSGGAIYINSVNNSFYNSIIVNNSGSNTINLNGGSLINCTIANNVGGVYLASTTATTSIKNSIVWGCATTADGATETGISGTGSAACILNNNATYTSLPAATTKSANIILPSNNTNGDATSPSTTITSGPKFAKPTNFKGYTNDATQIDLLKASKWNILVGSPLIDKGTDVTETTDILGTTRTAGAFDIGAYEYTSTPPTGIEDITANNASIYAVGRTVYVNNVDGMKCYLYSIVGQQIKEINPSEQSFTVEQAGTYIVKCGNKSSKIIITQ